MINLEGLTEIQIEKLRNLAEGMRQVITVGDVRCIVTSGNTYHFDTTGLEQAKEVVAVYPIDIERCRVQIENPVESQYSPNRIRLMYYIGDEKNKKWIWVNIPMAGIIELLGELVQKGLRSPYDNEHHYFVGVAASKIKKMQLRCYKFTSKDNKTYYGGANSVETADAVTEVLNRLGLLN